MDTLVRGSRKSDVPVISGVTRKFTNTLTRGVWMIQICLKVQGIHEVRQPRMIAIPYTLLVTLDYSQQ